MLSFRVVKKLQKNVILVTMHQQQNNNNNSSASSSKNGSPNQSHNADSTTPGRERSDGQEKRHLLRIVSLAPNALPVVSSPGGAGDGAPLLHVEFRLRSKDSLLRKLAAFRSLSKGKGELFCRPDHASVQLLPAPSAAGGGSRQTQQHQQQQQECQVHLFASVDCPVGLFQHTLRESKNFIPKDEETAWRLLGSLVSALSILHRNSSEEEDEEDNALSTDNETSFRSNATTSSSLSTSFCTYYGELSPDDVYVYTTASGKSFKHDAPEFLDEAGAKILQLGKPGRSHVLQYALDVPRSIYYKSCPTTRHDDDGHENVSNSSNSRARWAAEDVAAVANLVKSICNISSTKATSTTSAVGFSQELRFLLEKMSSPDWTSRPVASQILNFQAIALRTQLWDLQLINDVHQRETHRLRRENALLKEKENILRSSIHHSHDNHHQLRGSRSPSGRSPSGGGRSRSQEATQANLNSSAADVAELRLREDRAAHREAKIELFLELYNLTSSQLDQLPNPRDPNDADAVAAARTDFSISLEQKLGEKQQQQQRQQNRGGDAGGTAASGHSPFGDVGDGGGGPNSTNVTSSVEIGSSATPEKQRHPMRESAGGVGEVRPATVRQQQHQQQLPPDSPELSPLPKNSDYGSLYGTPASIGSNGEGGSAIPITTTTTTGGAGRVISNTVLLGPSVVGGGGTTKENSSNRPAPIPFSPDAFSSSKSGDDGRVQRADINGTTEEEEEECEVIEMMIDSPVTPNRPFTAAPDDVQNMLQDGGKKTSRTPLAATEVIDTKSAGGSERMKGPQQEGKNGDARMNAATRTPPKQMKKPFLDGQTRSTPPSASQPVSGNRGRYRFAHGGGQQTPPQTRNPSAGGTPGSASGKHQQHQHRSPSSAQEQRVHYEWMSAHLSNLESMQKTLHETSSTTTTADQPAGPPSEFGVGVLVGGGRRNPQQQPVVLATTTDCNTEIADHHHHASPSSTLTRGGGHHQHRRGDTGAEYNNNNAIPNAETATAATLNSLTSDPVVARLMSLVQSDASTAEALKELREQVKTSPITKPTSF